MVANLGKPQPPSTRRGTRRRRRRESALVWWALFAAFAVAAWALGSWPVALLGLLAWCLYQFMLVPTFCRVTTQHGSPCTERARGRLFACDPSHQRAKADALWRLVGLRDPFRPKPAVDRGAAEPAPSTRPRLEPIDSVLVLLAAAGTIVTLIGMVYGF